MGDYTTQLRFICESKCGYTSSKGFQSIDDIITDSANDIFNFDWPIFDETYRLPLEKKILRHFYTREICEETFGLWQLRLWDRLNVIMPYYNQLYKSELIKFNPLYDVDLTTEHSRENDGLTNKTETGVHNFHNSNERTANRSSVDDGTNDTDFIGRKNVNATTNQIEQGSSNITNNDTTTSNLSEKNQSTDVNSTNVQTDNISNGKNVNRFSDTPQGQVNIGGLGTDGSGQDGNASVESVFGNAYLTNVTIVDDETKNKGSSNTEGIVDSYGERVSSQTVGRAGASAQQTDNAISSTNEQVDNETNSTKNYSSNIHEGSENEKSVGGGGNTNEVSGRVENMSTEDFIQRVSGKRGGLTYSKMLDEFRKTFLNIDKMILNDLESLFMALWE